MVIITQPENISTKEIAYVLSVLHNLMMLALLHNLCSISVLHNFMDKC